jgi:hypothetical protein
MRMSRLVPGIVLLATACGSHAGDRGGTGGAGGRDGAGGGGGDVAGETCATMQPCGGDVTGTWTITAACIDFTLDLGATCPGLTSSGTTTNTGSAAFRGDLTYDETFTVSGTLRYQYPSACLLGRTCAEQQDSLMQSGSAMGAFASVACQSSGAGCDCEGTVMPVARSETGTYSVGGGILTTVHNATTDRNNYCVVGALMHQMPIPDAGTPIGTVTGTVTLSRAP